MSRRPEKVAWAVGADMRRPVSSHCKATLVVAAAVRERDTARRLFDALDATWRRLAAGKTNADLGGYLHPAVRHRLDEDEAQAGEVRHHAWRPAVAANEARRLATLAAQQREAAAAAQ